MRATSMLSRRTFAAAALAIAGAGALAALLTQPSAAQSSADPVIYLDQAWSQADREWYYNFSQGSSTISYDIFLNVEVAGSQELFRSDANMRRYGLVPQVANPRTNPDGLPIGLSKTAVPKVLTQAEHVGDYVGFTCSACHNGSSTTRARPFASMAPRRTHWTW